MKPSLNQYCSASGARMVPSAREFHVWKYSWASRKSRSASDFSPLTNVAKLLPRLVPLNDRVFGPPPRTGINVTRKSCGASSRQNTRSPSTIVAARSASSLSRNGHSPRTAVTSRPPRTGRERSRKSPPTNSASTKPFIDPR